MMAIIAWGKLAAPLGIPVSKSHALLAGLAGAGLAGGVLGVLQWDGSAKVGISLGCSLVLGLAAAFVLARLIIVSTADAHPTKAKRIFDRLQVASACRHERSRPAHQR